MLLGDLGMNVIKGRARVRRTTCVLPRRRSNGCARGKRSLALNVKDPRGHEIALELVRQADVVSPQHDQGVATRLVISYPDCRAINPSVIYCNTYAYGLEGPLSHSGGLDPLFQASGGIEYEQGATHLGQSPIYVRFGFTDQANAVLSVVGVLLALALATAPARARSCGVATRWRGDLRL